MKAIKKAFKNAQRSLTFVSYFINLTYYHDFFASNYLTNESLVFTL